MEFWNPVLGCTPVSPGCRICCSARTVQRTEDGDNLVRISTNDIPRFNGNVKMHEWAFDRVATFPANAEVFVCGQSDLFHEKEA